MLWLKFKDEDGEERRVEIRGESFTIGRHSACDLTYSDSRLSREHAKIERNAGHFTVSDLGSSNGTLVNGNSLSGQAILRDGDVIDLGGGLEATVELVPDAVADGAAGPSESRPGVGSHVVPHAAPEYVPVIPSPRSGGEGIPTAFFIIAPLLGIFVLAVVIGAVFLFGGGGTEVATGNGDDIGQTSGVNDDDEPPADDDPTPKPERSPTPIPVNRNGQATSTPGSSGTTDTPPSGDLGETAKVEQNSAAFLRQIAQNDPRAFLTGEQAAKVSSKIKQVGKSSALTDNLNSARKNAAAIRSLAASKNLKPQFLAVAAITKLGSSRGDVLQTAQSVADIYDKLGIQIGNENFDDALLMIAAYDQGVAGETMKMRNMLQDLATKSNEGARTIRSIWFLEKTGKISSGEYDRALNFLAIGTIAQNPKDFGVNAEALKL